MNMEVSLKINQESLFKTISEIAESLESELYLNYRKGIFFVPELHFAFEVGKAIFEKRNEIFGLEQIEWLRETNLGNGGPSDLVFKVGKEWAVFEFKISDTWKAYEKDIKKLQNLSEIEGFKGKRYFVALVDAFPGKQDGRMDYLKNLDMPWLGRKSIEVNYSRYVQKINCELVCIEVV